MKTASLVVILTTVLVLTSNPSHGREFGWTISDSSTDPFSNTGTPVPGIVYLYLWYYCTNTVEGLDSASFDICSDIGTLPLAYSVILPCINALSPTQLLIYCADCPLGPQPVGYFLFLDGTGDGIRVYPCPSTATGWTGSKNCIELDVYENDYIGYASDGSPVPTNCDYDPCRGVAVESTTWGSVKTQYR